MTLQPVLINTDVCRYRCYGQDLHSALDLETVYSKICT